MDKQPKQPDREPDALDRLLVEARWVEPTPEAIDHLRGRWRRLMTLEEDAVTDKRRPARELGKRHAGLGRNWQLALVAAMVLVFVGLAVFEYCNRASMRQQPERVASYLTPQAEQPAPPPVGPAVAEQAAATRQAASMRLSRPPNAYELVMHATYRRVRSARQHHETACSLQIAESDSPDSQRATAPALAAPASCHANQPELAAQRQWLVGLLSRGDVRSVELFLDRIEDPRTTAVALESLADVPKPPLETLFQCLRGSSSSRRMAAALVLGRLDCPTVSQALIVMAIRGVHRQEAMVALLSSSETTARRFLVDAEQDPSLAAALWNAKHQLHASIPWRS